MDLGEIQQICRTSKHILNNGTERSGTWIFFFFSPHFWRWVFLEFLPPRQRTFKGFLQLALNFSVCGFVCVWRIWKYSSKKFRFRFWDNIIYILSLLFPQLIPYLSSSPRFDYINAVRPLIPFPQFTSIPLSTAWTLCCCPLRFNSAN